MYLLRPLKGVQNYEQEMAPLECVDVFSSTIPMALMFPLLHSPDRTDHVYMGHPVKRGSQLGFKRSSNPRSRFNSGFSGGLLANFVYIYLEKVK